MITNIFSDGTDDTCDSLDGSSITTQDVTTELYMSSVFSHPEEFLTTEVPPGDTTSKTPSWCVPGKCVEGIIVSDLSTLGHPITAVKMI